MYFAEEKIYAGRKAPSRSAGRQEREGVSKRRNHRHRITISSFSPISILKAFPRCASGTASEAACHPW